MVKVKYITTGEIVEVTANVAHGLVESGAGVIVNEKWYETREMRTSPTEHVQVGGRVRDIPAKKSTKSSKTYQSK